MNYYEVGESMLVTCESCKSEFLTESDPYVIRPTPQGYKLYCCCMIKGFEEIDLINTQLKEAVKVLQWANTVVNPEKEIEEFLLKYEYPTEFKE